jgi:Lon-like ATP-dependent protease
MEAELGDNLILQIYRKAALRLVQELGEETFPEPAPAVVGKVVESQEPPSNEPSSSAPEAPEAETAAEPAAVEGKPVTTQERKPMPIPDTVHVRITPENLKDYVGPPVYQKDRLYVHAPPPGVSTGLGYLGNGSGAVMPVEAIVSFLCTPHCELIVC